MINSTFIRPFLQRKYCLSIWSAECILITTKKICFLLENICNPWKPFFLRHNKAVYTLVAIFSWRFQRQGLLGNEAKDIIDLNIMETRRMLKYGTVSVYPLRSLVHVNISFIDSTFSELVLYG